MKRPRGSRAALALAGCLGMAAGCGPLGLGRPARVSGTAVALRGPGPRFPKAPVQRDGPSDERTVLAGGPAGVASATSSVPGSLFAATEGAPDIFPRLLRPKGEPAPEEPLGRTSRFGLRLGLLIPTSAEEGSWESAARLGLYYRSGRKIAFELGMDYASVDGEYGPAQTVTSEMYFLRFDTVFGFSSGGDRAARFFLLGGGELGLESATWEPTGDTADRESGSLNIGAGIGSPSGSWDARVVYSIFVGSENAAGAVTTAFGYAF